MNLLQVIAWTKMVGDFTSQGSSFSEATEKTLSGDFPCEMCRAIAEARLEQAQESRPNGAPLAPPEDQSSPRFDLIGLDEVELDSPLRLLASNAKFEHPAGAAHPDDLYGRVPTPPPQLWS